MFANVERISTSGASIVKEMGPSSKQADAVAHATDFTDEHANMSSNPHEEESKESGRPLFSFGVITDVQYADIPDGKSFGGTPRFYRHSLQALGRAVSHWNKDGDLSFAMHFGDIVDGFCPKDKSVEAIKQVVGAFDKFKSGPVYHMLGNHCLYNAPRATLNSLLSIPGPQDGSSYYDFCPYPGFRFVVLDGYDVSLLGWGQDHPNTKLAEAILAERNPNQEKNSPEGLVGLPRRFVKFGGGVSEQQLGWLEGVLRSATKQQEKVIIASHLPLEPTSTAPACLLWNFDQVLELIAKYECVVACFSGHAHKGGYALDSSGVHHRVLEAVLECPPGTNAYGRVDVYADRLRLHGEDRMESSDMPFPSRQVRRPTSMSSL